MKCVQFPHLRIGRELYENWTHLSPASGVGLNVRKVRANFSSNFNMWIPFPSCTCLTQRSKSKSTEQISDKHQLQLPFATIEANQSNLPSGFQQPERIECFLLATPGLSFSGMKMLMFIFILAFTAKTQALQPQPSLSPTSCRTQCGTIDIRYPFAIDDGCGAPQFRHMFNCSSTTADLFFITPSGSYKVQHIDYKSNTLEIYDPAMSTCSILQPHHDFAMTPLQSYIIPPTPDTVFALLNCSIDSPVLNHYKNLCFNISGHSCDELYGACNAFRVFRLVSNSSGGLPGCCFTGYDTVRYMSMNILDCTHYTSVVNSDGLRGVGALDWVYGMKLTFSVPETGCGRCLESGGTCGFDTETEGMLCLCSASTNATRLCGMASITAGGERRHFPKMLHVGFVIISTFFLFTFGSW